MSSDSVSLNSALARAYMFEAPRIVESGSIAQIVQIATTSRYYHYLACEGRIKIKVGTAGSLTGCETSAI